MKSDKKPINDRDSSKNKKGELPVHGEKQTFKVLMRQKKWQTGLFCVLGGLVVIACVAMVLDNELNEEEPQEYTLHDPTKDITTQDAWLLGKEREIEQSKAKTDELDAELRRLKTALEGDIKRDETLSNLKEELEALKASLSEGVQHISSEKEDNDEVRVSVTPQSVAKTFRPEPEFLELPNEKTINPTQYAAIKQNAKRDMYHTYGETPQLTQQAMVEEPLEVEFQLNQKDDVQDERMIIPATASFRAILLNGADLPTGNGAQASPRPIKMEVVGMVDIPNHHVLNTAEGCYLSGSAWADISSERAFIQLDLLSCTQVDEQGRNKYIETSLSGYVNGLDGKVGVRGRLVTRDAELINSALTAGALSGLGGAVGSTSGTKSVSPLGTTTTQNFNQMLKGGLGQGFGNAMDKLAEYKIKKAEALQPIIELDSLTTVDVVLYRAAKLGEVFERVVPGEAHATSQLTGKTNATQKKIGG